MEAGVVAVEVEEAAEAAEAEGVEEEGVEAEGVEAEAAGVPTDDTGVFMSEVYLGGAERAVA